MTVRSRTFAWSLAVAMYLIGGTGLFAQGVQEAGGADSAPIALESIGINVSAAGAATAMRGYSPVSLLIGGQWLKGREPFRVHFDGVAYLLANEREVQMFRAAPERFVPVFGGDCVVKFALASERKAGLLRHGVVHENRLYFFSSDEARREFVENPARYMNVDVALGGNCPVCIVELNKSVPGRPELAAVLGGNRYLFPGAQQREMFLAQPHKYAAAAHAMAGAAGVSSTAPDEALATMNDAMDRERPASERPQEDGNGPGAESIPPPGFGDAGSLPVAVSGYCPVSILDDNRWVRGRPEYAVAHDGRRYLLASEAHKQAFLADLAKYLPALGGDCVVSFHDKGERIEGSVYHAVVHRGRHYFFPGLPQKEAFKQNPDTYVDADLAHGGNCVVRLVETEQQVAGKPEFTAFHHGLRFQLAGQEEFDKFRDDPEKYATAASTVGGIP